MNIQLRVYIQIQHWLNFNNCKKMPTDYGWHMTVNGLQQIYFSSEVKPLLDDLQQAIACA